MTRAERLRVPVIDKPDKACCTQRLTTGDCECAKAWAIRSAPFNFPITSEYEHAQPDAELRHCESCNRDFICSKSAFDAHECVGFDKQTEDRRP